MTVADDGPLPVTYRDPHVIAAQQAAQVKGRIYRPLVGQVLSVSK